MSNLAKSKESFKVSTSFLLPVKVCNAIRLLSKVGTKEVKYLFEDMIVYYMENHPRGKELMAAAEREEKK